jgi:hypothetical protein
MIGFELNDEGVTWGISTDARNALGLTDLGCFVNPPSARRSPLRQFGDW